MLQQGQTARRLHFHKDDRDSRREIWNYLTRRLSCNYAEMTASAPFSDLFLATNLQEGDGDY
jgi:hypothetical protein